MKINNVFKMTNALKERSSLWIGIKPDPRELREYVRIQIDHKHKKDPMTDHAMEHKCGICIRDPLTNNPAEGYAVSIDSPVCAFVAALEAVRKDQEFKGHKILVPIYHERDTRLSSVDSLIEDMRDMLVGSDELWRGLEFIRVL